MLPLLFLDSDFCERRRTERKEENHELSSQLNTQASPPSVTRLEDGEKEKGLSGVRYRFGEARLEEMHPGNAEAKQDGERKAGSGGHRKKGGDREHKACEEWKEGRRRGRTQRAASPREKPTRGVRERREGREKDGRGWGGEERTVFPKREKLH